LGARSKNGPTKKRRGGAERQGRAGSLAWETGTAEAAGFLIAGNSTLA